LPKEIRFWRRKTLPYAAEFLHFFEVAPVFSQFALHERLLKAVAELKFVEPTPVQAAAIPLALQGRDLRVTAQTGSGKTAAFVLPMLNRLIGRKGPSVSIRADPAADPRAGPADPQASEAFSQFTFIKSGLITGGEDFKEQAAMLRKVPDILIGTPGRLLEQLNAGNLDLSEVEVLVLDEADRMLDMGFAEDMQRLCKECENRQQTLLFSATTGGAALRDMIGKVLNNPEHLQLNSVSSPKAPASRSSPLTTTSTKSRSCSGCWPTRPTRRPSSSPTPVPWPTASTAAWWPGLQGLRAARREGPEGPQAGHRPLKQGG
jgi:superfamily II DNA/RNA helicase